MMDSKAGCYEKSDNDGDLDSDDIASTSSGSQVLISHEQQDESGEKQEDSRFKRRKTAKFKKHPDAPKRFRRCVYILLLLLVLREWCAYHGRDHESCHRECQNYPSLHPWQVFTLGCSTYRSTYILDFRFSSRVVADCTILLFRKSYV